MTSEPDHAAAAVDAARREADTPLDREAMVALVTEIVGSLDGEIAGGDLKIYAELESLAKDIRAARAEIAALRPDEIQSRDIPTATDELDAVVGATEKATGEILDAAEQIQTIAEGLDKEIRDPLVTHATNIFEACNFQDITGQRITKVVRTLKHIESRIDGLVEALGEDLSAHLSPSSEGADSASAPPAAAAADSGAEPAGESGGDPDRGLLHGPQNPDQAIDQDEIDRLLAEFD
ncbi:MAG: protein phosphatase CheZ [Azospirillaceae bacterium]